MPKQSSVNIILETSLGNLFSVMEEIRKVREAKMIGISDPAELWEGEEGELFLKRLAPETIPTPHSEATSRALQHTNPKKTKTKKAKKKKAKAASSREGPTQSELVLQYFNENPDKVLSAAEVAKFTHKHKFTSSGGTAIFNTMKHYPKSRAPIKKVEPGLFQATKHIGAAYKAFRK